MTGIIPFISNVDHHLPDDTGSQAPIKRKIPVRLPPDADLSLIEPKAIKKVPALMVGTLVALESTASWAPARPSATNLPYDTSKLSHTF